MFMKTNNKMLLIFLLIYISINSYSQTLSIKETVNYINERLKNGQYSNKKPAPDTEYSWSQIAVSEDGRITWSNLKLKLKENKIRTFDEQYFYLTDFNEDDLSNISLDNSAGNGLFTKIIECKNRENCVNYLANRNENNEFTFSNTFRYFFLFVPGGDLYERKKAINAYKYLFSLVLENEHMKRKDTDPFAPENYNKTVSGSKGSINSGKTVVQLKNANGVYNIAVSFDKIVTRFILDSGASDIAISSNLESVLLKNNLISNNSYLPNALYRLADGSVSECKRVLIKRITVGNLTLRNVVASVGNSNTPLLLGRSFLDKFQKWSIDNNTAKITLEM